MKRFLMVLGVGALVLASSMAQAAIIDDFSSDTSTKYDALALSDYAGTYGRNASDQFAPTPSASGGGDTAWLRNDGYAFNVGDTISLELYAVPVLYQSATLAICHSLTDGTGAKEFGMQNRSDLGGIDLGGSVTYNVDLAAGPVTATLVRTSATSASYEYAYHVTGGGMGLVSGTDTGLTAGAYYFGMGGFNNGNTGVVMDNLSYTAVPEPSALILLASGLIGLLAYAWRKRK